MILTHDIGTRHAKRHLAVETVKRILLEFAKTRDPEATIARLLRAARLAQFRKEEHPLRSCLVQLVLLYRSVSRHESALRCCRRLLRLDPSDVFGWLTAARSARALGRHRESLDFVKKGMELELAARRRYGAWLEAEMIFEAGVIARLLGDFQKTARCLRRFLRYPHVIVRDLPQKQKAQVLLEEAKFALGKGDVTGLARAAKAEFDVAKHSGIAAAAMALAAQARGDVSSAEEWRTKAVNWALASTRVSLAEHEWQLTFAILRRLPEVGPRRKEKERRQNEPRCDCQARLRPRPDSPFRVS